MQPNACSVRRIKQDMTQQKSQSDDGESSFPEASRPPRRNGLPPEILQIIGPAFQVGGAVGRLFY
jgi:hypothetical protein